MLAAGYEVGIISYLGAIYTKGLTETVKITVGEDTVSITREQEVTTDVRRTFSVQGSCRKTHPAFLLACVNIPKQD